MSSIRSRLITPTTIYLPEKKILLLQSHSSPAKFWIKNAVNTELEAVKIGSNRKSEIVKKLGMGELSREQQIVLDEFYKGLIKSVVDNKTKDKGTFNPPSSNIGGE